MKTLRASAFAIVLLFSAGCATTDIIRSDYVAADRATYNAVTPGYLNYVQADSTLSKEEKARRARTVSTWRLRLEQAEKPIQPTTEGK